MDTTKGTNSLAPLLLLLCCACLAPTASAGILWGIYPYGVIVNEGILSAVPSTTLGGGGTYIYNSPTNSPEGLDVQQNTFSYLPLSYADSVTAADPAEGGALYTASSNASVSTFVVNGPETIAGRQVMAPSMSMNLATSGGTLDPNVQPYVQGSADTGAFWYDNTIHIGGVPAGTPVMLQVTGSLDAFLTTFEGGSASLEWALQLTQQDDEVGCHSNAFEHTYDFSPPPGSLSESLSAIDTTQSFDVCTASGETLSLLSALYVDLSGSGMWSASADVPDPDVSIESLTPGAFVTTASAVDYSAPATTSVPESATLALMALGLAGLAFARREQDN